MPDSIETSIILNGDPYPLDGGGMPLTALLERLKMRRGRVAVEINREIVPKARYDATIVRVGDRVEIVNFVGGG
jgi:sulfur carrier protein